ncbi:hypothetical protein AYI70_g3768, partial [Smittium culicis]
MKALIVVSIIANYSIKVKANLSTYVESTLIQNSIYSIDHSINNLDETGLSHTSAVVDHNSGSSSFSLESSSVFINSHSINEIEDLLDNSFEDSRTQRIGESHNGYTVIYDNIPPTETLSEVNFANSKSNSSKNFISAIGIENKSTTFLENTDNSVNQASVNFDVYNGNRKSSNLDYRLSSSISSNDKKEISNQEILEETTKIPNGYLGNYSSSYAIMISDHQLEINLESEASLHNKDDNTTATAIYNIYSDVEFHETQNTSSDISYDLESSNPEIITESVLSTANKTKIEAQALSQISVNIEEKTSNYNKSYPVSNPNIIGSIFNSTPKEFPTGTRKESLNNTYHELILTK